MRNRPKLAPSNGKVLRFDPPQAMPPRQRVGLLIAERAVDLGDDVVGDGEQIERSLRQCRGAGRALLALLPLSVDATCRSSHCRSGTSPGRHAAHRCSRHRRDRTDDGSARRARVGICGCGVRRRGDAGIDMRRHAAADPAMGPRGAIAMAGGRVTPCASAAEAAEDGERGQARRPERISSASSHDHGAWDLVAGCRRGAYFAA